MRTISAITARRIALAAQGFTRPRPAGRIDVRHVRRVVDDVGVVQLDSVNVAVRTHYMPFFSRLGPYPRHLVDDLAYRRRELFEYWGHVMSLLPIDTWPLWRPRMEGISPGRRTAEVMAEHPEYMDRVLEEVAAKGPVRASDLDDPGEKSGPWWGHGKGKTALEWHFAKGALTVAERRNFTRYYDLPHRVLPAEHLNGPPPSAEEADRALLLRAARHLGVATLSDLADYYRIRVPAARPRVAELVAAGQLEEVHVDGWDKRGYLHPQARRPRRVAARALLSPFDSLIWERDRTERLFGFDYRIEIYVPAPQRTFGYYVYPFLLGEELVARVDLKADRTAGVLVVPGAFLEAGADAERVAPELAAELWLMAGWLELDGVRVGRKGNLAAPLRRALG